MTRTFEHLAALGENPPLDEEELQAVRRRPGGRAAEAVSSFLAERARLVGRAEADEMLSDVADKIQDIAGYLDDFLTLSAGVNAGRMPVQRVKCDIWELDPQQAQKLARVWLNAARKDKRAAAVLRIAMEGDDYLSSALILGPRLAATALWYPDHGGFNLGAWRRPTTEKEA